MLSFPRVAHCRVHRGDSLSLGMADPQLSCIVWVHLLHAPTGGWAKLSNASLFNIVWLRSRGQGYSSRGLQQLIDKLSTIE